jgi:TonB family protein
MKKSSTSFCIVMMLTALCTAHAQWEDSTQQREGPTCAGRVYEAIEIPKGQRVKITSRPVPSMTQEALSHDVRGRMVLEAILCRTGEVTDVKVLEGLPYGMTEKAVEAILNLKFIPAEMNWHTVSQKVQFEFSFNETGLGPIPAKDAEGRLVEAIELVGNRLLKASEIMQHFETKPGEPYDAGQVQHDLASILAMGLFDSNGTRVTLEAGVRGGVVIVFEVQALPLISDVKFQGLEGVAESVVIEVLLQHHIDLRNVAVYDPAKIKIAMNVIEKFLGANGQTHAKVEVREERLTADNVTLTFVITRE